MSARNSGAQREESGTAVFFVVHGEINRSLVDLPGSRGKIDEALRSLSIDR